MVLPGQLIPFFFNGIEKPSDRRAFLRVWSNVHDLGREAFSVTFESQAREGGRVLLAVHLFQGSLIAVRVCVKPVNGGQPLDLKWNSHGTRTRGFRKK